MYSRFYIQRFTCPLFYFKKSTLKEKRNVTFSAECTEFKFLFIFQNTYLKKFLQYQLSLSNKLLLYRIRNNESPGFLIVG